MSNGFAPSLTIGYEVLHMATETPKPLDSRLHNAAHLTGTRAAELAAELSREDLPEGVLAPICLATPHGLAPHAYIFHNHASICDCCRTIHQSTEVFALYHLRSRAGAAFVRHLTPVQTLEWQVPIHLHNTKPRTTPFCFECIDSARAFLTTLPKPPQSQLTGATNLPDAIVSHSPPKSGGRAPGSTKNNGSKKSPTLDDVL
jgi:hypothetical protein